MKSILIAVAGLTVLALGFAMVQQGTTTHNTKPKTGVIAQKEGTKLDHRKAALDKGHDVAVFAAGCFWGVESDFRSVPGVLATAVGFTGGKNEHVTYEQVCAGTTGHAEAVVVEFDPKKVSYEYLVRVFFENHDPTTMNSQGPDFGEQYRSAIFYFDDAQRAAAEKVKNELTAAMKFRNPIVTQIVHAGPIWMAEDYHQQYYEKKGIFHNACRLPRGGGG